MTTTAVRPMPAPLPTRRARRGRARRWLRFAIPFAVLLAVWLATGIAHVMEEPDFDEPGTLSPLGTGRDGSSLLAQLLTDRGVGIDRVTSSQQALRDAAGTDATLFVPAPDFLNPRFLSLVEDLAGSHRVVVVQPGLRTVLYSPAPIFPVRDRWASATVAPGCDADFAVAAGPAAALNEAYLVDGQASVHCYAGGLAGFRAGDTEIIYVGASDPFRNGRIGEGGNAALATGLLGETARIVWIDVHRREPVSLSPVDLPGLPQYRRGEQNRDPAGTSTVDAFPPALWAGLALAFGSAILLALARARRLGSPVAEPLPVLVPAAEIVTGRGRLYERIEARGPALEALRGAAIARITMVLNPFGGPAPERDRIGGGTRRLPPAMIAQVAGRTGMPDHTVSAILSDPITDDDDHFARAVADLDALVDAVLNPSRLNPSRLNPSRHPGGTP